ncbi:YolD-like family protein [Bacillus sp. JCM 19034]|uniref:YolD-like family protein n=1 Tax=Bacillus sp. JCM 19034 TaxID=1481928 RepID=UPI0007812A10|nr:YolD-like family protein [Bacillus sp. JCM 19034]
MKKLQRGNKLWHMQFILPEHSEALQQWYSEQDKVPKPSLDEQVITEIGFVMMDSLNNEIDVKVVYWKDGFIKEVIGIIDRVDRQQKYMKILTKDDIITIKVDCLMSVDRI